MRKRNLYEDYKSGMIKFLQSDTEEPIIIGKYSDYVEEEFLFSVSDRAMSLFVHMDDVYIIGGTSYSHEHASRALLFNIYQGIQKLGGLANNFVVSGSAGYNITNILGCGRTFCKEPDESIRLRSEDMGDRTDPGLVIEIAYSHETFGLLLYEAAAHLSPLSQVEYCLVLKLWPYKRKFRARIMLFRRSTPQYFSNINATKDQIISSFKKQYPSICLVDADKSSQFNSKEEIEAHFGITLIADFMFTEENIRDANFSFQLDIQSMAFGSKALENSHRFDDFIANIEISSSIIYELYREHERKWRE